MNGWILDLYPGEPGEMVVWMKEGANRATKLVDRWTPSFYVACDSKEGLRALVREEWLVSEAERLAFVTRYARVTDGERSEVLEVKVRDAKAVVRLAAKVERSKPFGFYRIYNADVPPAQAYLYERDLFPLAYCKVKESGGGLEWQLQDDVWSCDYPHPPLSTAFLRVEIDKEDALPRNSDPIKEIRLKARGKERLIGSGPEAEKLRELVESLKDADPDILFTDGGDSFLFSYLAGRARESNFYDELVLGRDGGKLELPSRAGNSFFRYGRIEYKSSTVELRGRIHVDVANSFSVSEVGLDGLYELSRTCRMPLHASSRASIGRALSSLQFYHASKQGLLVPWKPTLAEHFKSRLELLVADRGGFIFEPRVGLYEGVAEFDFSALYPNIMLKKNVSGETVRCDCCPDSKNRVPELGWNVCEKKVGIVPQAMEIVVGKRLRYKKLKEEAKSEEEREKYDGRQMALKWIGVTCLPKETPMLIRRDGRIQCKRIGDFVDGVVGGQVGAIECPPDILVAGVGPDLKTKFCRIQKLIKLPNHSRLLGVSMDDGRRIAATSDHPFFVLEDAELKMKPASELHEGDFIPVAKLVPRQSSPVTYVDIIEHLTKKLTGGEQRLWRVAGAALKGSILANKHKLITEAMAQGYAYQVVEAWISNNVIPLCFFPLLDMPSEIRKELRIGVGRRLGGRMGWIPAVLPLDERLGFFLGMFVADGSAGTTCIRLDIGLSEPDLLESAIAVIKSIFGLSPRIYKEKNANMYVLQVNCATLVRTLERVFDLPGSAEKGKLKVPEAIFNSDEGAAQGFIEGLIAGDGYVSKRRGFINIATASKELCNQVAFLSSSLGLTFRIARVREGGNPLNTVNFAGLPTLRRIAGWRFLKQSHRNVLMERVREDGHKGCAYAMYESFPVGGSNLLQLAREARTIRNPRIDKSLRISPPRAEVMIHRIEDRLGDGQDARSFKDKRLLESDLGFVRVRKVTELDRDDEYVYCFQLDDSEIPGFFAGEGLVYIHNCFGYLGFNNAKFGRIDAHIAVCAWDRKVLLDSARVAEAKGFRVIHGIVDSLWVKKEGATEGDCLELREEIEKATGFDLSFEGLYRWIAFLPSKVNPSLPVANRYFGAYRSGGLKVRGIEARRHDTPPLFTKCQMEMLSVLAKASGVEEARRMVPDCVSIFERYASSIMKGEVGAEELVISRSLSKAPSEYVSNTLEASTAAQLEEAGVELHPGQSVGYVIADYGSKGRKYRTVPAALLDARSRYDRRRYLELLAEACTTVLEPFGRSVVLANGGLALGPSRFAPGAERY